MSALEKFFLEVELAKTVDTDPVKRLRRTVEAINKNLSACGAEVECTDGQWRDVLTKEQTAKLKLEIPECASLVEEYETIEASVKKVTEEFEKLEVEIS